ncbi:unnamed protein product [Linum tenue]|uniref:Lipid droplet-associated hydrolase n=1 Tax=Linum tenue TaxID=586396 RepID=A0AAV0NW97_9ROSI|nr:unnamed protein product [Linum tenue]
MGSEYLDPNVVKLANFRVCKVSSYTTELLEIQADNPTVHVLFVPGNPGNVLWLLTGSEVSMYFQNWEQGQLFSLQQQINHKVDFLSQELQETKVPIVLVGNSFMKVGHSIGAYITMEMLKRKGDQVIYFIGLYPFIMVNPQSKKQANIAKVSRSSILSCLMSLMVASIGLLPKWLSQYIVVQYIGNSSWSTSAVETARGHLLKYHLFRNMLYMAMTEFKEFSQAPDWEFMKKNQRKMTFLFGDDDHWGPLQVYEEVAKQVPDMALMIEREGLSHSFCCTEAGSIWVARHVASLIKIQTSSSASAADDGKLSQIA